MGKEPSENDSKKCRDKNQKKHREKWNIQAGEKGLVDKGWKKNQIINWAFCEFKV